MNVMNDRLQAIEAVYRRPGHVDVVAEAMAVQEVLNAANESPFLGYEILARAAARAGRARWLDEAVLRRIRADRWDGYSAFEHEYLVDARSSNLTLPHEAGRWLALGRAYALWQEGDVQRANTLFVSLLRDDPQSIVSHYSFCGLGRVSLPSQIELALNCLKDASEVNRSDALKFGMDRELYRALRSLDVGLDRLEMQLYRKMFCPRFVDENSDLDSA